MAPLPRWLDKARATRARLITAEPDGATVATTTTQNRAGRKRTRDADYYADIPPFLLPLSVRVKLDKEHAKHKARSRSAPYDRSQATSQLSSSKKKRTGPTLTMPAILKRLAGPRTCPIVVAQYKDEYRGVGHEEDLHWALVVITDAPTLSGPSFQAYSQRRRRRTKSSKTRPSMPNAHRSISDRLGMKTTAVEPTKTALEGSRDADMEKTIAPEPEYDTQWYARHAPASLYDVCATVRTLCLGGVQVGAVRAADVGKLDEYLRSHPPVPAHAGWSSRDYVLELMELLRPFKLLRDDLQSLHLRKDRGRGTAFGVGVEVADLLPELREVGRVTQESIFNEEFRPYVKYHP